MLCLRHFTLAFLSLLVLIGTATAQDRPVAPAPSSVTITATASTGRVRITAPASIVQMHMEVYAPDGEKLFDQELRGGNVFDWHLQNGQAERLSAGDYVCVVTVKNVAGRIMQKLGTVRLGEKEVSIALVEGAQLSAPQAQAIGPVGEDSSWTILSPDPTQTTTVIAHDGTDGQVIRGRGALSFRIGDFFSGDNREQMRLTDDGNLGIGTDKPQAKLDVSGDIRATGTVRAQRIEFPNGTVQTSGQSGKVDAQGNVVPNATGTGTQGRLAKWIDNSGTLGDSVAIDTGTGLQLTAAPSNSVDTNVIFMSGNDRTAGIIASSVASFTSANGPYFALRGNTYNAIAGQRGLFAISAGSVSSPTGREGSVIFNTGNDQIRMLIDPTGNVGIGTTTPAAALDVMGNINTSTQYHIGGARVLSAAGTNNIFAGAGAGAVNQGSDNTFVGFNAGNANTTNVNFPANENAFFGSHAGESNTSGIRNSFFGAFAGRFNTTGNDNSIFGDRAGVLNNGSANAIFGTGAGFDNTGSINSFFGRNAGNLNTSGSNNSFFGGLAGNNNTTGSNNSFVGENSGLSNTAEDNNTFIGANANGIGGIINATAIGANSSVTQNNSMVLGSINGVNGATADTSVGVGVTSPEQRLSIGGGVNIDQNGASNGSIVNGLSFGHASGEGIASKRNAGGNQFGLDFYTQFINRMSISQSGNVGIGTSSPSARLDVRDGSGGSGSGGHIQVGALVSNADEKLILFGSPNCSGPCVSIGEQDAAGRMVLRASTFRVRGGHWDPDVDNTIQLGQPSNRWSEVWAVNGTVQTSDARLKKGITNLNYGLHQVMQLRPVTFQWKDSSDRRTHVGLIAQEVQSVMPEMIEGQRDPNAPLGMNYNNLIPVLIKAIQEQQATLNRNEQEIKDLRAQNYALSKRIHLVKRSGRRAR